MATTKKAPASLLGLNAALIPEVEDPLGTNRKQAGLNSYYEEARKSDPRFASGPLPDREWAGWFQSLADNGVTKLGQDAARPMGIADAPEFSTAGDVGALHQPVNPNTLTAQDLENQRLMRSNNVATPASLRGLQKASTR